MAVQRLTGKNRQLAEDWEEFLRTIRTHTAVDFTMTDAERAEKLRYLEARPLEWMRFMFYKFAKYEFAEFQKIQDRTYLNDFEREARRIEGGRP